MGIIHEDQFVVFVREDRPSAAGPEAWERELVSCPTYEEALWVCREMRGPHRKCIVRFVGPAGGGD
jgi:hypothetical protein